MSDEIEPHITERYHILKKLGKGAYGVVWKAIDLATNKTVALKKVYDAFQNATDAQRTYREVMYLQHLNGHENIVRLLSLLRAQNNKDLYLVFEPMETDLHVVIRAGILKNIHKTFIIYQLFKALKYLHSADLVHRDLKPSNMLMDSDCIMKLADFGLARSVAFEEGEDAPVVSDYIATRWYRAPEIVLGSKRYSKAVDMWSAGCILAEILLETVLFAGKSSLNQIELIISLLGRPDDKDLKSMKIAKGNETIMKAEARKIRSISLLFKGCPEEAIDLVRKLLVYNPEKRITVTEALSHPFFKKFHNPKEEIECKRAIIIPIDDNDKLSLKAYRDAIYNDISVHIKRQNPSLKSSNITTKSKHSKNLNSKNTFMKAKNLKMRERKSNKENMKRTAKSLTNNGKVIFKIENRKQRNNSKMVFKKKNKSEDFKTKKEKRTLLNQTTKFNKKIQISKSKINSKQKLFRQSLNCHSKKKGFFKIRRNDSSTNKLVKKNSKKKRELSGFGKHIKSSSNFNIEKKFIRIT